MKKNQKGFTLIELLAVIAILSIIMLVAIPNVMGIIDKNKRSTYIENAQQMITLAQYKLNADTSIPRPNENQAIAISLKCLNTSEIEKGPEGWMYNKENSVVIIERKNGTYQYYVTLKEENDTKKRGIDFMNTDLLNSDGAIKRVTNTPLTYSIQTGTTIANSGISSIVSYSC